MSRPLRVALVHPHTWPEVRRGGERYLNDLAWYLAGAGHEVTVLTGTDDRPGHRVEAGADVHRLRHVPPGPLASRGLTTRETFGLAALPRLLRRRFDVVHALTPTAALAARAAGHRTVYTIIGHPEPGAVDVRRPRHRVLAAAVRRATVVTALSRASADGAEVLFGRRPVHVLPPGVRVDAFPPDLSPRTGPPRVLFPADAGERWKRVDVAMAAVSRLLARRPDARLGLGGPGDHGWALARLGDEATRLEAATDVLGAGSLDDVPDRYRAATVTILPSGAEAFGLVLVESLACGTPVVCSDSGGKPEIVDSPAIGRVAPLDDPDATAAALDEVIDLAALPGTPAACVAHARRWGWLEAVGPAHESLYRSMVDR